jgi:hypothetical protein
MQKAIIQCKTERLHGLVVSSLPLLDPTLCGHTTEDRRPPERTEINHQSRLRICKNLNFAILSRNGKMAVHYCPRQQLSWIPSLANPKLAILWRVAKLLCSSPCICKPKLPASTTLIGPSTYYADHSIRLGGCATTY